MPGIAVLALFAAALPTAVVLQPVANMYSRPSTDADVVSQAIYGANVGIVEQKDGWAHIRTADDYLGWTPLSALLPGKPYAAGARVADRGEPVRAHLSRSQRHQTRSPDHVPFESRLEVVAEPKEDGRWYQVRLPDDRAGWVQAGDITLEPKRLTISETLEFSKRFLGLPYTWGGTSSYGYDCSGFSQMLGRRRGVSLPRDAQPQADWSGVVRRGAQGSATRRPAVLRRVRQRRSPTPASTWETENLSTPPPT